MNIYQILLSYIVIGHIVTQLMITYYRPDGNSKKPGELYQASFGPLIWPLLIIKFACDMLD